MCIENKVVAKSLKGLEEKLAALGEPSDDNANERADLENQIKDETSKLNIGLAVCEKLGFELVEFEESVVKNGGVWVKFCKLPAPAPPVAAAGGKAAPPKGKGAAVDELKPTIGSAWLDLNPFKRPGNTQIETRVFLNTVAPAVKETNDQGVETFIDQTEFPQVLKTQKPTSTSASRSQSPLRHLPPPHPNLNQKRFYP